ncbi:MAG: hypothetical protein COS28_03335 [Nitrospirae bacterium CG02_land_8_20_14_3_00_44_33]|nr:MAG: hypothetical protein AUJ60_00710 [Nitrospirae bacterium CG1_02_44_142]PIV42669.1 MAG: hypothetical protein COS28_03335 [Nitrospirae bacterium CG02_land_8_20_14_3_00_44_33]
MGEKKNYIVIAAIFLIVVLSFCLLPQTIALENRLTFSVLFATLLAIIWYTVETNKVQLAMKHQIEVSTTALLTISFDKTERMFELANVGNATAINIAVDDVVIDKKEKIRLTFPSYPYLRAGERKLFSVTSYKGNEVVDFPFEAHLIQELANKDYLASIKFEDILRREKCQQVRLGVSGPKLLSTEEMMERL